MEEEEIAEVEMLLEAYFMHVDNTYNRCEEQHQQGGLEQPGGLDGSSKIC